MKLLITASVHQLRVFSYMLNGREVWFSYKGEVCADYIKSIECGGSVCLVYVNARGVILKVVRFLGDIYFSEEDINYIKKAVHYLKNKRIVNSAFPERQ